MLTQLRLDNRINGFLGRPGGAGKRPAIIHLHERYGIVQHTTDLAQKLVEAGYVTVVPDLFSRFTGDRQALARGDSRVELGDEEVFLDVDAIVTYLHTLPDVDGSRIAMIGVCQTGRQPMLIAAYRDDLSGIVVMYGAIYNADWRAEVELPELEHFTVQSGGFEVDAWVMRPAGFEPGRRYPALVNIHGGPFAQYGWTFFDEFQVQAGAGYAVICCNPRGSSGREEAIARAIVGCPGEPDSAAVLAALDEALRRYDFIASTRLGLLGGGYGGYLTGWIVGHTERFVAAVAERGLYNRYSKDGTSDIWSGYTYLRVRQWEDPELYWRYSPIAYVRNIRTPLLILHSEEDLRCPIEQAEQLFVALKQRRREVRFVRFPGENHELSRSGKPSHRLQRFGYILDWFAEKLAAPAEALSQAAS